jgi:hypothetical protein
MRNEEASFNLPREWRNTGVFDSRGNPYVRLEDARQYVNEKTSLDDSSGSTLVSEKRNSITLSDLRLNVGILNGAAIAFTSALVTLFLWIVDRIDDRFEQVNAPLQDVRERVAVQTEKIERLERDRQQLSVPAASTKAAPTPAPTAP